MSRGLVLPGQAASGFLVDEAHWVFPCETGQTPLDPKNFINRVFSPALDRAGIRDFRWHDLRHTFASRLVMRGVDIRTVQELMGHKTLALTQRYSHLSPAHKLDAVQRLTGADLGRATGTATGTRHNEPKAVRIRCREPSRKTIR
jgi:site-specific recombinase XerD